MGPSGTAEKAQSRSFVLTEPGMLKSDPFFEQGRILAYDLFSGSNGSGHLAYDYYWIDSRPPPDT